MLTWSDWHTEPRSNRYYYAVRFAQHLPVFFVQPDRVEAVVELEPTQVEGVSVAHVYARYGHHQAQLLSRMLADQRLERPLLWIYNPYFESFVRQYPAPFRIYHATEDYFCDDFFSSYSYRIIRNQLRLLLINVDLVIAVSEGVQNSYAQHSRYPGPYRILPNGCDYEFWSSPPIGLSTASNVAVFQGGINRRLDFQLLYEIIVGMPDWEFWFCGQAHDPVSAIDWNRLCQLSNVRYFGALDPQDLKILVYRATVGLIPFLQNSAIDRSVPLKAFEYVAAGLPVVSVPIQFLNSFGEMIYFATTSQTFKEQIRKAGLTRFDDAAFERRSKIAQQQDYNLRFAELLNMLNTSFNTRTALEHHWSVRRFYYKLIVVFLSVPISVRNILKSNQLILSRLKGKL